MEKLLFTLFFSAALSSIAVAAPPPTQGVPAPTRGHELSFEVGTTHDASSNAEFLHGGEGVTSNGLRLGYGLSDHWSVIGGWHRTRYGRELYLAEGTDEWSGDGGFRELFVLDQLSLGLKARQSVNPWLVPYMNLQLVAARGSVRFDDAAEEDDNPNELRARDWAPGAMLMAGVEVDPLRVFGGRLGSYLELGYDYTLPIRLVDDDGLTGGSGGDPVELGDVQLQGFALRWGIGYHF